MSLMLSYTILAACKARGSSLRVHFKRCPMMKSGLQTAEAMLMATIKKKKETPFILKNLRRLHYAERKIKIMKRDYVKATNSVLVLNMRLVFLAALNRMLMKLLLVRMGFPRKYMRTT